MVATALGTIIRDLNGSGGYDWVGTAYLLLSATMTPLYAKSADILGRKVTLFSCYAIFALGSACVGPSASSGCG